MKILSGLMDLRLGFRPISLRIPFAGLRKDEPPETTRSSAQYNYRSLSGAPARSFREKAGHPRLGSRQREKDVPRGPLRRPAAK